MGNPSLNFQLGVFLCKMNYRIAFAAFNVALAVALGALGAHFLKEHLPIDALSSFETGVRYHLIHGLALLVILCLPIPKDKLKTPWFLMALGMLLFSLSIYGLSTRSLFGLEDGLRWLGPITPLGGLFLIGSWLWIAITSVTNPRESRN